MSSSTIQRTYKKIKTNKNDGVTMSEPNPVTTCKQIMASGRYCECPALRDAQFCYYHQRDRQRRANLRTARRVKNFSDPQRDSYRPLDALNSEIFESLDLPALDDPAAIQVCFTNIMRAVYADHISLKKAGLMLNSVHGAARNLHRHKLFSADLQPSDLTDPEPIPPLGDEEGYVLPQEAICKKTRAEVNAILAAEAAGTAVPTTGDDL
jgi:hypothetical protein